MITSYLVCIKCFKFIRPAYLIDSITTKAIGGIEQVMERYHGENVFQWKVIRIF